METTPQVPPVDNKRRSNLLTPELGVDIRFKDILKLLGFFILLQGLSYLLYPKSLPESNSMLFYPLMCLLFLWAYKRYDYWPSFAAFGITKENFKCNLKVGWLWGAGTQVVSVGVHFLLAAILGPWAEWAQLQTEPPLYAWGWAVHIIGAVVFAPLIEEIIFRGVIFGTANQKRGRIWAYIITGVVFSLMHGINPVTFGQIFVVSASLTLLYERQGNLAAPIIAHGVFNLVASVIMLLCPGW